jgi:hypothetical protein
MCVSKRCILKHLFRVMGNNRMRPFKAKTHIMARLSRQLNFFYNCFIFLIFCTGN